MDYSIIIPVFNKAALTRQCLETIRATLEGAGDGEVIVVDNASSDETPEMLREFPWVRVIRNETNRGYAGANNQGAREANGKYLVLLNNDIVAQPGWLASMLDVARQPNVGVVGARLLFPNGTIQHAGVRIDPLVCGVAGFVPFHDMAGYPGTYPEAQRIDDVQIVTGACLLTSRDLYLRLDGLDETFWNGYEDVDYCLRVRELGLRVVYDGEASLTHFESQSGIQRFRKAPWNTARLAQRWNGRVRYDAQGASMRRGFLWRTARTGPDSESLDVLPTPRTTVLCHGAEQTEALEAMLRANDAPIDRVVFVAQSDAVDALRNEMELRGDRYLAVVDARCRLQRGWLDRLIAQCEFSRNTAAATSAPELQLNDDTSVFTADARCTVLSLRKFPQHLRVEQFPTVDAALADLLIRAICARGGTRACATPAGELPQVADDAEFARRYGMRLADAESTNPKLVEDAIRRATGRRPGLVSIVMLSWNAPQYTKMALESIRAHTPEPYEVIIVDNGSERETVEWLRTLKDVRIIYNSTNRGYAGGNNQAMAAARGEYVVLLNNDVVVTDGWLESLLAAFDRIPGLGVSAPRSNKVAGDQITPDAQYNNMEEMHVYAAKRRERFQGEGYLTDRAIGLCLCIDRTVIEEIGGIDERFGVGNFEDDDFCMRVRAAGYRIFVCDDAFIHHFGSQTFAANKIDWTSTMRENWKKFAAKWGYPEKYPENGYPTTPAIRAGFDRARHYVPLPLVEQTNSDAGHTPVSLAFTARVTDERDWNEVGAFVRRYVQAFTADDPTLLSIIAAGELSAVMLGARVEKVLARMDVDNDRAADIEIVDGSEQGNVEAAMVLAVESLSERSPSALRRALETVAR